MDNGSEADDRKPILWLMYLFNFLDRNAIINARLNGLAQDIGLVGTQYNTCVSILFVGYGVSPLLRYEHQNVNV